MGQIKNIKLHIVTDIKFQNHFQTSNKMVASRNTTLAGGISKLSRSAVYRKRALYKRKKVGAAPAAKVEAEKTKVKPIGGDKNGQERVVPVQKESRFYPTEDVKKPLRHRKTPGASKLKKSLTPGTIVILLAGRHKGKRVVFLKDLQDSGLILITGPYAVNGVPLRRVPQSYVIGTQTKVDISGLTVPANINDDFFKKPKAPKKKDDELFFEKDKESTIDDSRKQLQKDVDAKIVAAIDKTPLLKQYLSSKFSLKKGDKPHE